MLRSESEQSVEENMDPPSYTRKILREELKLSEQELTKYQKVLAEKAAVIQRKIALKEEEDIVVSEVDTIDAEEAADKEGQLVPVENPMDMNTALALMQDFEGEVDMTTLSDIDEAEIEKMILGQEERELKTIIWNNLNKDWIAEQKVKKRTKKAALKQIKAQKLSQSAASSSACNFSQLDEGQLSPSDASFDPQL